MSTHITAGQLIHQLQTLDPDLPAYLAINPDWPYAHRIGRVAVGHGLNGPHDLHSRGRPGGHLASRRPHGAGMGGRMTGCASSHRASERSAPSARSPRLTALSDLVGQPMPEGVRGALVRSVPPVPRPGLRTTWVPLTSSRRLPCRKPRPGPNPPWLRHAQLGSRRRRRYGRHSPPRAGRHRGHPRQLAWLEGRLEPDRTSHRVRGHRPSRCTVRGNRRVAAREPSGGRLTRTVPPGYRDAGSAPH